MKKIAILAAMVTLLAAGAASAETLAFSATKTDAGKAVLGDSKPLGKLSANVSLAATHDGTGYAIATQHLNGTKCFGTSHDATAIYSNEAKDQTLGASNSSAFGSGWTAM